MDTDLLEHVLDQQNLSRLWRQNVEEKRVSNPPVDSPLCPGGAASSGGGGWM